MEQKVVLWFDEEQKYQFLSCPLPPVCPVPEVVLSCPSIFSKSNAPVWLYYIRLLLLPGFFKSYI